MTKTKAQKQRAKAARELAAAQAATKAAERKLAAQPQQKKKKKKKQPSDPSSGVVGKAPNGKDNISKKAADRLMELGVTLPAGNTRYRSQSIIQSMRGQKGKLTNNVMARLFMANVLAPGHVSVPRFGIPGIATQCLKLTSVIYVTPTLLASSNNSYIFCAFAEGSLDGAYFLNSAAMPAGPNTAFALSNFSSSAYNATTTVNDSYTIGRILGFGIEYEVVQPDSLPRPYVTMLSTKPSSSMSTTIAGLNHAYMTQGQYRNPIMSGPDAMRGRVVSVPQNTSNSFDTVTCAVNTGTGSFSAAWSLPLLYMYWSNPGSVTGISIRVQFNYTIEAAADWSKITSSFVEEEGESESVVYDADGVIDSVDFSKLAKSVFQFGISALAPISSVASAVGMAAGAMLDDPTKERPVVDKTALTCDSLEREVAQLKKIVLSSVDKSSTTQSVKKVLVSAENSDIEDLGALDRSSLPAYDVRDARVPLRARTHK